MYVYTYRVNTYPRFCVASRKGMMPTCPWGKIKLHDPFHIVENIFAMLP